MKRIKPACSSAAAIDTLTPIPTPMNTAPQKPVCEWLTWSQCVRLFQQKGLNRKIWEAVVSQDPPVIERRIFPGSKWQRYRASDVLKQL